ncbi:septum formation family protein [Acrocarpospora catenulata]|uniref:septum formation family protein n=1 Tax=Acrocarpospora catenulata TaxID=2836182 RepID=UPI001BDAD2D3|nr:septum formation family protein [Acrocarpospora catenulata]
MPLRHCLAALLPALTASCGLEHATAVGVLSVSAEVGSCHRMAKPEELYTGSDTAPPVPCTEPHQSETYLVTGFTGELAAASERPGQEQLLPAVTKACDWRPIRRYLGADDRDIQWGLQIWGKFPTRAEWAAGDRTIRCDLLAPTVQDGAGPEIAVPLAGIMRRPWSALVRRCRLGAQDTICARPHDSELIEPRVYLTWHRFPQDDQAHRRVTRLCRDAARAYARGPIKGMGVRFDPVTRANWRDRQVSCWITHPVSTTTLRGGLA